MRFTDNHITVLRAINDHINCCEPEQIKNPFLYVPAASGR